jgi:hypothetical protein
VLDHVEAVLRSGIVSSWTDIAGRRVVIRQIPYDKVTGRHGLQLRTVRRVIQLVNRVHDGGTAYRYETYAREYRCSIWSCTVLREQLIRVVVDFRILTDGQPFGVVTAYCPGAGDLCPAWVNTAING